MQQRQGKIIQKQKMQELSSLFMTHRINVMHALVKFHEYIPYSLGVMARTGLTIWNLVTSYIAQKESRFPEGRILSRRYHVNKGRAARFLAYS